MIGKQFMFAGVQHMFASHHMFAFLLCLLCVCRHIGKLARSIKSRKHPAANLVKRYLCATAVHHLGWEMNPVEVEVDEDNEQHPLVPLGPVTWEGSEQPVYWPETTRFTSTIMFKKRTTRLDLIIRSLLPQSIMDRNAGAGLEFNCFSTHLSVRIGLWTYSCTDKEDCGATDKYTVSSWFAIKIKHVPHVAEQPDGVDDPEQLVYGQFVNFVRLHMLDWTTDDRIHLLGKCKLYEPRWNVQQDFSRLPIINTKITLKYQPANSQQLIEASYVPLKHVLHPVALGNVLTGWKPIGSRLSHDIVVESDRYMVMHLTK